jgi:uncharacterized Zn finger protein (UPF0148 family)
MTAMMTPIKLLSVKCPHCKTALVRIPRPRGEGRVVCPGCGTIGNDDDVMTSFELEKLRRALDKEKISPLRSAVSP